MAFLEIVPDELLDKNKQSEFVDWLRSMPIELKSKKYILIEWAREVDVLLTRDLVLEVLGTEEL